MRKLLEVGRNLGHEMVVLRPEQFELLVTASPKRSVMVDNEVVSLPDAFLPRMGAGTTYFALSVIRQ